MSRYPNTPGYKSFGTSKEAADQMRSRAKALRQSILEVLRLAQCTTDEVAEALDESVLSVRPRFSELKQQGLIIETAERRKNESGKFATVWRAL